MYGLFTYMWVVLGVNVGKYHIHWAFGIGSMDCCSVFGMGDRATQLRRHEVQMRLKGLLLIPPTCFWISPDWQKSLKGVRIDHTTLDHHQPSVENWKRLIPSSGRQSTAFSAAERLLMEFSLYVPSSKLAWEWRITIFEQQMHLQRVIVLLSC